MKVAGPLILHQLWGLVLINGLPSKWVLGLHYPVTWDSAPVKDDSP